MARTKHEELRKLVISAMFLAVGLVLPFLTGQIKQIGNMMLPMPQLYPTAIAMPVELATYGFVIGFISIASLNEQICVK